MPWKSSPVVGAFVLAVGCWSCTKTDPGSLVTSEGSASHSSEKAISSASPAPANDLSRASIARVKDLPQPMTVDLYVSRSAPHGEDFAKAASELLARYKEASRGPDGTPRFTYKVIDPRSDEEKKAASEAGMHETAVGEGKDGSVTLALMFSGIAFKYGAELETIPFIEPTDRGLELLITQRIGRLRRVVEHHKLRVGALTVKGGVTLDEDAIAPTGNSKRVNVRSLMTDNFPYELVDVDLDGGKSPVADDLKALIITQPGSDLSDDELHRIDEFVMRGDTALAVFASAVELHPGDSSVTGHLERHRLDQLLAGYGVTLNRDAVFDIKAGWALANGSGSGPNPIVFSWIPELDPGDSKSERRLDDSFLPFWKLSSLTFPFSSSLTLQPSSQPEAQMRIVARSSSSAVLATADKIDFMGSLSNPPSGAGAARVLGVALEPGCCDGSPHCSPDDPCRKGLIHSTFSDPKGKVSSKPSRVLVVSSAQFFTNPFTRASIDKSDLTHKAHPKRDPNGEQLQLISGPFLSRTFTSTLLALSETIEWLGEDADLADLARRDANPIH